MGWKTEPGMAQMAIDFRRPIDIASDGCNMDSF